MNKGQPLDRAQLAELAHRFLTGTATEQEMALLHEWYDTADPEEIERVFTRQPETQEDVRQRIFTGLESMIQQDAPVARGIGRYTRWLAAASVVVALGLAGTYFLVKRPAGVTPRVVAKAAKPLNDLPPGTNKARLTMGDGSVVDLADAANGVIKDKGGIRIDKRDGQLIYDAAAQNALPEVNTIQTPRGGQYQVVLPDGTKVWLNSASSLSYPTAFSGKDRQVRLNGEAYFEVADNKNKPFSVTVGDLKVDVLGTHFDVMAYDDEHTINTTLLEGAVMVTDGKSSRPLGEGQEATFDKSSGSFRVQDVNADMAVAWKNGFFQFGGVPIETVMRQLARWYDVDVEYQGKITEHFRGMISRSVNVSEVLKMLELTGAVHFRIEGKKIIVMP